jgi:hypothetical protein
MGNLYNMAAAGFPLLEAFQAVQGKRRRGAAGSRQSRQFLVSELRPHREFCRAADSHPHDGPLLDRSFGDIEP